MSKILSALFGFGGSIFSGLWGYLIVAGGGALGAMLLTWHLVHINNAAEISDLQTQAANQRAANISASLTQLQSFIATMHNAETGYNAALQNIDARFAALQVEFKNATQKPLPVDCKPDASRVRSLHSAISGTNTKPPTANTP